MGNRADRRASAKIAKQAVKRAKTPLEGAILRAAAAFADEGPIGQLDPHLSRPDFDETWTRIADDLHDILEEQYPDFLVQAYIEAGLGAMRLEGPDGAVILRGLRLFLCPVVGEAGRVADFTRSRPEMEGFAQSLREFGVVSERSRCMMLPSILPVSSFATEAMAPGEVRAICDALSAILLGSTNEGGGLSDEVFASLAALSETLSKDVPTFGRIAGALIGIELMPAMDRKGIEPTIGDLETEALALAAAAASWADSYVAEVPGLEIGVPLDWPACAAALAWETLFLSMDEARRRKGLAEDPSEVLHCAPSDDGSRLVFSAIHAGLAIGPFSAPTDLVWLDADEFFERAEASTRQLVEHEDEGPVIAPLLGIG